MKNLLSQGGDVEHVSFCKAFPPPQKLLSQL